MARNHDIETLHAEVPLGVTSVLVVDDEALFAKAVVRHLEKSGYRCAHAGSLAAADRQLAAQGADLVLLDMRLPDGSGLDFLQRLRARSAVPVIVMTAYGEVEDAVQAMKCAASDYLKKPVDLEELRVNIEKVLAQAALGRQLEYSRTREISLTPGAQLIGASAAIDEVRQQVARIASLVGGGAAPAPTVLITGETGTGKDVTARLLHQGSARAALPFVHVDCAALPKDLIESELFGHVKGAFTHALAERTGLIEAAEDGVVFLDEIGELPLELQAKLLAVLERRTLRRIGSSHELRSRAWFIAATNRPVAEMVASGALRADLYYRLKVLTLELPPLRARGDDIRLLAEHFLGDSARRYGARDARLSAAALERLCAYGWPGNVRELSHVIERAVLLSGGGLIDASALALGDGASPVAAPPPTPILEDMTLEELEKTMLARALKGSAGNISEAARRLGITRMAMRYRMDKHGLRGDEV
ncbi:MAG: sigma-54-dependent Fis family transcriptional regulator [Proteobacteria bacterium]|nr:sigma-54-dependent Fis family transcriptional regulator [Pseudomonadota bacterium]